MTTGTKNEALKPEPEFSIKKIYVKDISFETSNTPEIFNENWQPQIDLHITNEAKRLNKNLFEVILSVTITAKVSDKTAYLVEVNQAGIFMINNIPKTAINRLLATTCTNILFPFVRETVADLVMRSGFPQLLLSPVNFEALYMQQQEMASSDSQTTH